MVLIRLLVFDRKYSCVVDIHKESESGLMSSKTIIPLQQQPVISQSISKTQSTFTVKSPALLPNISDLSLGDKALESRMMNTIADPRLVMGACYSLCSILQKLSPESTVVSGFHWDASTYRLLYFKSPTGWHFIALQSLPCKDSIVKLAEFYERIFLPIIIKAPVYYKRQQGERIDCPALFQASRAFFSSL